MAEQPIEEVSSLKSHHQLMALLQEKASPTTLATILNINPSYVYQEAQKGRLPAEPKNSSYLENLQFYINFFKNNTELKLRKHEADQELKKEKIRQHMEYKKAIAGDADGDGSSTTNLGAKKLKQDIRVGVAKEAEIWLKVAMAREKCLFTEQLLPLLEPFMIAIRSKLLGIAKEIPEAQTTIDEAMEELYLLGSKLLAEAKQDSNGFLEEILETEFDLDNMKIEELF